MSKLAIGTVQLGLRYGINQSDHSKPPESDEVVKIFESVQKHNVSLLDTAFEYGNSEEICGNHLSGLNTRLVTKTPKLRAGALFKHTAQLFEKAYEISCQNLQVERCDSLLVHDFNNLFQPGGEYLVETLNQLKQDKKVDKVGVSIYSREDLEKSWELFDFDVIQLPLNILDQRLYRDGSLAELKARGVEVHIRSAFLQGLLLMEPSKIPNGLDDLRPNVQEVQRRADEAGVSTVELCYQFLNNIPEVDHIVCGINTATQLNQIAEIAGKANLADNKFDFSALEVSDDGLLNPGNWAQRINI